jgi:hypothetical protein
MLFAEYMRIHGIRLSPRVQRFRKASCSDGLTTLISTLVNSFAIGHRPRGPTSLSTIAVLNGIAPRKTRPHHSCQFRR